MSVQKLYEEVVKPQNKPNLDPVGENANENQDSGRPAAQNEDEIVEDATYGIEGDDVTDDEDIVEDETDDEAEDDEPGKAEDSDDEESEFSSVDDFAEALGLDTEDLLAKINTKVKIDGQEVQINLKELHEGYQRDSDYRRKTAEVADQRRQVEQIADQISNSYSQRLEELDALSNTLEEMYISDYKSIDWGRLRNEDSGMYAALQQDMKNKQSEIQAAKAKVQEAKQRQLQEFQAKVQTEIIPANMRELQRVNPEWKNQEKWISDYRKIMAHAVQTYGFTPEQIASVYDHKSIQVVWDAMRYHELLSEKNNGVKKIQEEVQERKKKVKKVLKPGSKPAQRVSASKKRIDAARKRLKSSGSVDDAAQLLLARMNS